MRSDKETGQGEKQQKSLENIIKNAIEDYGNNEDGLTENKDVNDRGDD